MAAATIQTWRLKDHRYTSEIVSLIGTLVDAIRKDHLSQTAEGKRWIDCLYSEVAPLIVHMYASFWFLFHYFSPLSGDLLPRWSFLKALCKSYGLKISAWWLRQRCKIAFSAFHYISYNTIPVKNVRKENLLLIILPIKAFMKSSKNLIKKRLRNIAILPKNKIGCSFSFN